MIAPRNTSDEQGGRADHASCRHAGSSADQRSRHQARGGTDRDPRARARRAADGGSHAGSGHAAGDRTVHRAVDGGRLDEFTAALMDEVGVFGVDDIGAEHTIGARHEIGALILQVLP
ncbi:hypothetical protein [Nocardia otitidiscaviarum]|uniref:hypothetical protein n=1 Tax=Nocardia otitidiscaviarum TaxID=1823 RepID=UPI002458E1C8|nr:hypothetical protein [Nocardia otitidiscaviarum]